MFGSLFNSNSGVIHLKRKFYTWREVVIFASILMELTWSILWYRSILLPGIGIEYWETYIILGGMLIGFYLIARVLNYLDFSIGRRRIVLGLLIIVNLVISLVYFSEWNDHNLMEMLSSTTASFHTRESVD